MCVALDVVALRGLVRIGKWQMNRGPPRIVGRLFLIPVATVGLSNNLGLGDLDDLVGRVELGRPGGDLLSGDLLSRMTTTRTADLVEVELLHEPGDDATGIALLRAALRAMASDGADAVLGWSFRHSPNYEAYAEAGFLPLPERLRPIELHFGVRPLNESLGPMLRDRSHWYISYCDSDTV